MFGARPTPLHATSASLDPPAELPPLEISADPLHPDDVTLRPYAIDREPRSGRAIVTLKDALAQVPGVLLQESFGGFEPPRLSIRGSGLQSAPSSRGVQFLLEGFPLTLADGSFNSALIDPQLADRIEVFRGATATHLAPAVLGGAVNLRSRDTAGLSAAAIGHGRIPPVSPSRGASLPFDRLGTLRSSNGFPVSSLRTELGSFGAARGLLSNQAETGHVHLVATGSFARTDGYRDHSAQQRAGLLAKLAFAGDATPSARLGTGSSLSLCHVRSVYDVPGPLTLAAAATSPRAVTPDVQRDQPRRESDATQLIAQTTRQSDTLEVDAGLSWLHTSDWFRQLRANGINDSQSDDLTFRGALTRKFITRAGDHHVRLGTTLSRGWRELRRYRNDSGVAGPLFGADGLFATTAAADLEATLRFGPLFAATVGLNGLLHRRDIRDRSNDAITAATNRRIRASAWQPRAELLWTPRSHLTFFAATSRAVEPPTFDDLLVVAGTYPNLTRRSQSLLDQRATTIELGARGTHGPFGWDVTGYQAHWDNEILRLADAQGLPRGAVNAGPTRHDGLETAFHWQILSRSHRLRLTTVATWSRFRFANDPVFGRNRLAGAPPHLGSARLLYEHPCGFFAGSTLDWTAGATPVDHANRMHYGSHALTHLRLGWRRAPRLAAPAQCHLIGDILPRLVRGSARGGWTVFVEVKNVFDRDHIASTAGVLDIARNPATTGVFLPGPGRAFNVGFEWNR